MTTHLSRYFKKRRLEMKLRLGELAKTLGYRNISKGARRVDAFETTGNIKEQLFKKLTAVLEIDEKTVNGLLQQDLSDWLKWANEPIRPYIVVRLMAAIYSQAELPAEVQSAEEAERYASDFAKGHKLRVCLVLSRKVSVYFADDGSFQYASEAVPGGEPNQPYTVVGGRRCLMDPTERGIALREVAWFKRPQPRGEI